MNDIERARQRQKEVRDRDHWQNDRADMTVKFWVNDEGDITCHELSVRPDIMESGKGRAYVVETLVRGAGRVGVSIANDGAKNGVAGSWQAEAIITGCITRFGASSTVQHAWLIAESEPGLQHRVKAARWLLRRVWTILGPAIGIAFDMVFRPARFRNLPR